MTVGFNELPSGTDFAPLLQGMPPGHTVMVTKAMKFLDFSPEKKLDLVLGHIVKKMAELSA